MKRKILISILGLLTLFILSACGSMETAVESTVNSSSKEQSSDDVDESEDIKISVYYSEDAMTFSSEIVQVGSLTIENVMGAMISKGLISDAVIVQTFEVKDIAGKKTIELDFNEAFSNELTQQGSTGEYYILGAVCNTLLEAFECEQIQITVDKQVLSTGHMEYDGYLQKFTR